jgi:hypothetical protein
MDLVGQLKLVGLLKLPACLFAAKYVFSCVRFAGIVGPCGLIEKGPRCRL